MKNRVETRAAPLGADFLRGLRFKAVVELAAPHTWGASIVPVLLAAAFSASMYGMFSAPLFYSLLLTSVCLQCAVNTLNDYTDFVKGVDTQENCTDPSDASIIYNKLDPKLALCTGIGFLLFAFLFGLYALFTAGAELIVFGAAGALIVTLYSFGKSPIAALPVGEAVSGAAMGGVITFACVYAFTGALDWRILALSLPVVLSIGLIMLTNNASDIERDSGAERITLPVMIGRKNSVTLHVCLTVLAALIVLAAALVYFRAGLFLMPLLIPLVGFPEARILKGGLTPGARAGSMSDIMKIQWRLGLMYAVTALSSVIEYEQSGMSDFMRQFVQWMGAVLG
ncbi:MAG: UbiA family prenyltransferase [Clostridiales Family XIII bacterium]|jgi:1,4-dihydroxy-2-naphthoate octaprenyltransferase|nr:UbiA family prenyltransferase [Clostridiales Family XIII bacterium]